jgi:anti-anti-sigma factor
MEFNIGMDGDIVIMELTGDLVANTVDELKTQVSKLREKNFNYVLLEMSKVDFMDSSGLGACMAVHKTLLENKGMLVIAKPSKPIEKIFQITRADQKLNIVPTKHDGIKSLHEKIIGKRQI